MQSIDAVRVKKGKRRDSCEGALVAALCIPLFVLSSGDSLLMEYQKCNPPPYQPSDEAKSVTRALPFDPCQTHTHRERRERSAHLFLSLRDTRHQIPGIQIIISPTFLRYAPSNNQN